MARGKREKRSSGNDTAANVGYEAQLWQMADALRGSMDAAEYKHVVLCGELLEGRGGRVYDPC